MEKTTKPPAHEKVESGDTALGKLKDLARRIVSVPKKEIEEKEDNEKRPRKPA